MHTKLSSHQGSLSCIGQTGRMDVRKRPSKQTKKEAQPVTRGTFSAILLVDKCFLPAFFFILVVVVVFHGLLLVSLAGFDKNRGEKIQQGLVLCGKLTAEMSLKLIQGDFFCVLAYHPKFLAQLCEQLLHSALGKMIGLRPRILEHKLLEIEIIGHPGVKLIEFYEEVFVDVNQEEKGVRQLLRYLLAGVFERADPADDINHNLQGFEKFVSVQSIGAIKVKNLEDKGRLALKGVTRIDTKQNQTFIQVDPIVILELIENGLRVINQAAKAIIKLIISQLSTLGVFLIDYLDRIKQLVDRGPLQLKQVRLHGGAMHVHLFSKLLFVK